MRFKMKNGKRIYLPESNKDDMLHTHEDGPYAGTPHSHEGGDQPHTHATHDEDGVEVHNGNFASLVVPSLEKMTKKALGEWAVDNGISVDSKKTKAKMIEEIKEQL